MQDRRAVSSTAMWRENNAVKTKDLLHCDFRTHAVPIPDWTHPPGSGILWDNLILPVHGRHEEEGRATSLGSKGKTFASVSSFLFVDYNARSF
jgi:hypothetical protein